MPRVAHGDDYLHRLDTYGPGDWCCSCDGCTPLVDLADVVTPRPTAAERIRTVLATGRREQARNELRLVKAYQGRLAQLAASLAVYARATDSRQVAAAGIHATEAITALHGRAELLTAEVAK